MSKILNIARFLVLITACSLLLPSTPVLAWTLYWGPKGYQKAADSPFAGTSFNYFYLENFEDGSLNTPGVSVNAGGVLTPGIFTDSVDADDGTIDGSGSAGSSYYTNNGATGLTFTFDAGVLGALPTHAGIVWTDASGYVDVTFEIYGPTNNFVAGVTNFKEGDGSVYGTTAEDRFYGMAFYMDGIKSIKIYQNTSDMEVDHLQYGSVTVPIPGGFWLVGAGLAMLLSLKGKQHR
jgi:hypothetical protein